MLQSMTAFARHETQEPPLKLVWELRTVNHRYLDVHLRLPEELRRFEPAIRAQVQKRLSRGRLDATVSLEQGTEAGMQWNLDQSLANQILQLGDSLTTQFPAAQPLSQHELMQIPGLMQSPELDFDALETLTHHSLDSALSALLAARKGEGQRIQRMLDTRLAAMQEIVSALRKQMPELEAQLQQRWQDKLKALGGEELDPLRLNQEMAVLLTKSDVAEELDRLDAHIAELNDILTRGEAVGRRLDFMMQELNREANTLGSKAYHTAMTAASVELKVLIDQMREQIQNVE